MATDVQFAVSRIASINPAIQVRCWANSIVADPQKCVQPWLAPAPRNRSGMPGDSQSDPRGATVSADLLPLPARRSIAQPHFAGGRQAPVRRRSPPRFWSCRRRAFPDRERICASPRRTPPTAILWSKVNPVDFARALWSDRNYFAVELSIFNSGDGNNGGAGGGESGCALSLRS